MGEQVGADLLADVRGTEFVMLGEGDRALFAVAAEAFGDIARGGGSSDRVPVAMANRLSVLLEALERRPGVPVRLASVVVEDA